MKHLTTSILSLLAVGATLFSCTQPKTASLQLDTATQVLICNEGNYMYSNASLSLYNPTSGQMMNQAFVAANGFPIGDVLQSATVIDGRLLLAVNNSGKILVADAKTLRHIGTIKGLTSPRYVISTGGNRLYISDLYSHSITIADLKTLQITGHIPVGRSVEQMVCAGDYVYACSWMNSDQVYKISTASGEVVDSLTVTFQPNSMVRDRNGALWVLSDGGYAGGVGTTVEPGALTKIDLNTFTITATLSLTELEPAPAELTINAAGDELYYINSSWGSIIKSGGLYKLRIDATSLPRTPFIPENGRTFYAIGVNPLNSDVYVSNAIDFAQRGIIYRYNKNGEQIDEFKADICPGAFYFM